MREQLEDYFNNCGSSFNDIRRATKIIYDPTDENAVINPFNIDFLCIANNEQGNAALTRDFSNLVTKELRLRKLSLQGSLEERWQRLKQFLIVEVKLERIQESISRGDEGKETAQMLISQIIPCIMHLENRVGEKLITVLLARASEAYQKRNTRGLQCFAARIQEIVNTRILGTVYRPKQWKMHLGEKNDTVLKVSLSNKKTRQFVENIGVLIDYVFDHPEDAEQRRIWHYLIDRYCQAMDILLLRREYTDDEIEEFQSLIDDFFVAYVEESGAGKEGITNYIHMLGSAHIKHYMKLHRNLYKFSQQGWESLNDKFKLIFFNHTQRGGNFGAHTGEAERSYLKSVFRAFQHELLWISGRAEDHFLSKNIDYI